MNESYINCKNCHSYSVVKNTDCWFDDKGFGYSTKLCKCPECGKLVIVGYEEDSHLDINNDPRLYK